MNLIRFSAVVFVVVGTGRCGTELKNRLPVTTILKSEDNYQSINPYIFLIHYMRGPTADSHLPGLVILSVDKRIKHVNRAR